MVCVLVFNLISKIFQYSSLAGVTNTYKTQRYRSTYFYFVKSLKKPQWFNFSCICRNNHMIIIFALFLLELYCFFLKVKACLHFCNKSRMIVMHYTFIYCWIVFANILLMINVSLSCERLVCYFPFGLVLLTSYKLKKYSLINPLDFCLSDTISFLIILRIYQRYHLSLEDFEERFQLQLPVCLINTSYYLFSRFQQEVVCICPLYLNYQMCWHNVHNILLHSF